jgi:hypothetical protein
VQHIGARLLRQGSDATLGNTTLVACPNATHGECLLVGFEVILKHMLNKSAVVSVIGTDFPAESASTAFKIVFRGKHLLSIHR